ncbi:hypothetical protein LUZ60_004853 [Juncus effusus]|nr:hypothetical protein LUZ60_004853 [Juncus effusus]
MSGDGKRRREKSSSAFDKARSNSMQKLRLGAEEQLESKLGFSLYTEGDTRLGWLLTFSPSSWEDEDTGKMYSCVDLYFVSQDGSTFKVKKKFRPYFYIATKEEMELEVDSYLRRKYEGQIADIELAEKEDLDLKNHLSGLHRKYLRLKFDTVQHLMQVRRDLLHIVQRNESKSDTAEAFESVYNTKRKERIFDYTNSIIDLREYDVPYHIRFAIDNDVRSGQWYDVSVTSSGPVLSKRDDLLQRADVHVCAFDIETTKLPLKFPDPVSDQIMMISYMIDGQGYLIINREFVGEDIENLEYTPKPEYEGCFEVTNVKDEVQLLKAWFAHMREVKPGIYVTYNGDFFDWPFIEKRAAHHGIQMSQEIGFQCDTEQGECSAKFSCHLDCFAWVKRDSYLPQGSQGLKAVTKAKLGYDPLEVDPEEMVYFAKREPQRMASYSVSDAVATYYLYMTYVHPFIFSLATIIPMSPGEVLRKGSGTLCEVLLMVQAYKANVICPNKHQDNPEKFYSNRLLESETYIGGHVECLETGVFRSDLPAKFQLDPAAYELLIGNLDRDLQYAITVEGKMDVDSISNYEEVKNAIMQKLAYLRDNPSIEENPLIYHLDVAAMYPNIILTNRLQPPSIVTDVVCTACDFNRPGKNCLRKLEWVWRGETYMAKKSDYYHIKRQIESEKVDGGEGQLAKSYLDLTKLEQQAKLKDRLKKYCQKAYKRVLDKPTTELREAGICMRENPFYVDTVRSFRDRRYEYKGLNKVWKGKLSEAKSSGNSIKIQEAQDMVVLYDSLQLAHKCILNSFYGYVMRKGARWYSMEMAGVVTYTGAKIIQNARLLVEKIGRPLELDTDGIWCALPGSFPENFTFKTLDGKKKLTISYPCVMLNVDVARNNTNDQYQTLSDPVNKVYTTQSECSIEFEVDGPYKAMILPASKEEGVLIKKRYAVFNEDGTLAELKGFEIKRRGELKLIKVFQAEVFDKFLHGSTLEECYGAVASVANRWLDMLDNQGVDLADSELLDLISESNTMSKSLADYGNQKSCAVTTAKRLADFLGPAMVKDKGLRCMYIVASQPQGTPVSERAVPVALFGKEVAESMRAGFLRKWCKISSDDSIRSIVDWSYYKQRLSSAIQKIITIPAAMQKVSNPVPRVIHPDWLHKKVREKDDKFRQRKINDLFTPKQKDQNPQNTEEITTEIDMEDFGTTTTTTKPALKSVQTNLTGCSSSKSVKERESSIVRENIEDCVDREKDYKGWLEVRKRKWKQVLEQKKRRRLGNANVSDTVLSQSPLFGNGNKNGNRNANKTNTSFFRKQELALVRSHWQIIQIAPSEQIGCFLAWVVADGMMFKVSLNAPRVFYINYKDDNVINQEGFLSGRRVKKTLPHSRPNYNLIEVVTSEAKFKSESKKLAACLAEPEVEGIYETKIPSEYSTILQLGCVCKANKGSSTNNRNLQEGWDLAELTMKTTTECSYLEQSISFFFLYHSLSEGRAIYVIYFPTARALNVVVINPFRNRELSTALIDKLFREACLAVPADLAIPIPNFKVEYFQTVDDGCKFLQTTLTDYRRQHPGPAVGVIECPNIQSIKSNITVLNDFPCVTIPCNSRDCNYQALQWQLTAGKIGLQRCAASTQWFNERVLLSRYAHVPMGNFELDWLLFIADVFYSRALRDQQQVLWISDDGIPDLGGTYEGDSCFSDEVSQPTLTYPGAYRRISVELKIHHLAVNSLLKSTQIDEMEGSGPSFFDSEAPAGGSTDFDDSSSCRPAFLVLKQLIQRCVTDAVSSGNLFADAILQHLYRWICSPSSKLHDPALHRTLHNVMKKVFALLLAELKKLGANIVFANFSKIIIDTGKIDLPSAHAYIECMLKTLQTRDLFEWIELEPQHYWHSFLFMDQYNFGGIIAKTENTEGISDGEIISNWNIAEFLPEQIKDHFKLIVSKFMYIPWKYLTEQVAIRTNFIDETSSTPSITITTADSLEASVSLHLRDKISNYFAQKLFEIVRSISAQKQAFNDSHNLKGDLALEFIKHVCAVLSLDQIVQLDILRMRKNLLKMVRVKEFAPEAQYQDSLPSFSLPNVICSYCNECRDLDLTRDSALVDQEWRCGAPSCRQLYDKEKLENALLQVVRQRERLYHLQDLVCMRCRQVKAAHLASQCSCGGNFRCKEEAGEFLEKMRVIYHVAAKQKFRLLEDCTSWLLEMR